ncbi:MAG: NAD(P)-binding domain-containing protein [Chloracidobacterium sp.]|nr:NAD(P)-binding domain-containing protein [Chloracidobacterium sp.]
MFDLIIIGAGPAGIMAAYEAKKAGLDYLVIEKGLIGNTIYNYPVGLTVFSTTNELEFEDGGLDPAREKPTREELLSYYVRFVLEHDLNVQAEEMVLSVSSVGSVVEGAKNNKTTENTEKDHFAIVTDKGRYESRNVLFAIGAMDYPRKLNVPGEDLPKVHEMFRETYPWVKKRALIIGGGNSAGEAALFLAQEGAETTLAIFRDDWESTDPKQGCIKYWVKEPLENELKEHCLNLFFLGKVIEIREGEVELENENGDRETEQGKGGEVPVYDPETFETNVPGVYVAGHFTHQRHIKGAIDASKLLVPKLKERLTAKDAKNAKLEKGRNE